MVKAPRIRPAQADEAEGLSALAFRSKSYWGYSSTFMEACREELRVPVANLRNETFRYNVSALNDRILGYYAIKRLSESTWELKAMFVEPTHIGKGIGRLLIEHAN